MHITRYMTESFYHIDLDYFYTYNKPDVYHLNELLSAISAHVVPHDSVVWSRATLFFFAIYVADSVLLAGVPQ